MRVRIEWLASALLVATIGCNTKKSKDRQAPGGESTTARVDERWAQVVIWAKPTVEPGDPALFNRAVELARDHRTTIGDVYEAAQGYAVEPGVLPAGVDEAVDSLVAWAQAGDGLAVVGCDDSGGTLTPDLLVAFAIARAALLTAPDDPEHPHVMAVLYLGHRLRGEGANGLEVTVGMVVSKAAVDWAKARRVKPGKLFRDFAPDDGVVFRSLAVEAVCQVGMIEAAGRRDQTMGTQLAAVRAFNTDTVHGAFRRKDDANAFDAYLTARAEQGRKRTKTPALKMLASGARVVVGIRKQRDAYMGAITIEK